MYPMPDATGYLAACATKSAEERAKSRDRAIPARWDQGVCRGSAKERHRSRVHRFVVTVSGVGYRLLE